MNASPMTMTPAVRSVSRPPMFESAVVGLDPVVSYFSTWCQPAGDQLVDKASGHLARVPGEAGGVCQQRCEALHPSVDGDVIDLDPALGRQLLDIAIGETESQVPPHPALFDRVLGDADIQIVLTGVLMPRMNSIMERWVQTCRYELVDRTLIWNEHHLRHAPARVRTTSQFHRPHQALNQAAPLRAVPLPATDPERTTRLDIRRHDRLGGVIHECRHAA